MLSRRKLLRTAGAAALFVPAAPYIRKARPQILRLSGGPTNFFPGGQGNPVGFAAAPGFTSLAAPTTLDAYATANFGGSIPQGTVISFQDFNPGTSTTVMSVNGTGSGAALEFVTFKGCRFQSNDVIGGIQTNVDCFSTGSNNLVFSYCSIVPLASLHTNIPNPASPNIPWPASSAGTGVAYGGGSYASYVIPFADGFQFGLSIQSTFGPITFDHCDIWGGGNLVNFGNAGTSQLTYQDCWVHDARNSDPPSWNAGTNYNIGDVVEAADGAPYNAVSANINQNPSGNANVNWHQISSTGDHTDGIGYLNGSTAPSNVKIDHCTIAMLGNTDCIGMQNTSSQYTNWTITNNYMSGNHVIFEAGWSRPNNANLTATGNVFATDLVLGAQYVNHTTNADWRINNNIWRNNRLHVCRGDTWSGFTSADEGKFLYPDNTFNSTDFT